MATTDSGPAVAVVATYYPPSLGGVQQYVQQIVERLRSEGRRVVVVCTGTQRRGIVRQVDGAVTVYRLPVAARLSNTPLHPGWHRMLRRIFAAEDVTVVNTHAPVVGLADLAVRVAGKRRTVLTYHAGSMVKGGSPFDPLLRTYERVVLPRVMRSADEVVTVSPTALGAELPRSTLISPGVDVDTFVPGSDRRPHRVLFVGRMDLSSAWKGVDVLLRAFTRLLASCPTAELRLVGAGDAVDGLRELAAALGCATAVTFTGQLGGSDLVGEYQRATVTVLPSVTAAESFGMTLVEAMACGSPVVGSRVGGIPYVISHDHNGLLVPPGDPVALAEACGRILADPDLARPFGEHGRTAAEQEFAWSARLDRWSELLRADA